MNYRCIIRQYLFVAAISMLVLSVTSREAAAAAGDPIPGVDISLEQVPGGFTARVVPCGAPGGNVPNTTTQSGYPACAPAETFHQQAGSPSGGWVHRADTSVKLKMKPGKNKTVDPLNPLTDVADVNVQLSMKGIEDAGGPATGPGNLALLVRPSIDDRVGGSMTLVDLPLSISFDVIAGKAKLKTSLNAALNHISQAGLPGSFSIEVIDASIEDPNGNQFVGPGVAIALP
jgi:hypothetical protein